jgi:sialidase-1
MMDLSTRSWTDWFQLPGATLSPPSIVVSGTDRLDLVVRGTNNGLYHKIWRAGAGWSSAWEVIPGATSDRPVMAVLGSTLNLEVRGMDNGIYINTMDLSSGTWLGWTQITGMTVSVPILMTSYSTVHMALRGTDNGIYYTYWS